MTRKDLEQFPYIKGCVKMYAHEINVITAEANDPCIPDSVKSQAYHAINLMKQEGKRMQKLYSEIARFYNSMDDQLMKQIICYRIIKGCSWVQVSVRVKPYKTDETLREHYYRHIEQMIEEYTRKL